MFCDASPSRSDDLNTVSSRRSPRLCRNVPRFSFRIIFIHFPDMNMPKDTRKLIARIHVITGHYRVVWAVLTRQNGEKTSLQTCQMFVQSTSRHSVRFSVQDARNALKIVAFTTFSAVRWNKIGTSDLDGEPHQSWCLDISYFFFILVLVNRRLMTTRTTLFGLENEVCVQNVVHTHAACSIGRRPKISIIPSSLIREIVANRTLFR